MPGDGHAACSPALSGGAARGAHTGHTKRGRPRKLTPCAICGEAYYARDWCHYHYFRWVATGDPRTPPKTRGALTEDEIETIRQETRLGNTLNNIAFQLGVSRETVHLYRKRLRAQGRLKSHREIQQQLEGNL